MSIIYGAFQGDGKQIPAGVNFTEDKGIDNDPTTMGGIVNIKLPADAPGMRSQTISNCHCIRRP